MDGTLYTYVKTAANRQKVQWEFKLTRNKSLELRAFINSYFASTLKVIDHEDRVWIGNLSSNPFDFVTDQRAAPAFDGWPKGESVSITLAFEGVQQ